MAIMMNAVTKEEVTEINGVTAEQIGEKVEEAMNKEYFLSHVQPKMMYVGESAYPYEGNELAWDWCMDMRVKYVCPLFESDDGTGALKVSGKLLDHIGVTKEELREAAKRNAGSYNVVTLGSVLAGMIGGDEEDFPTPGLSVAGSQETGAAAVFLNTDPMKRFCEKYKLSAVYVIPSSIHEVIVNTDMTLEVDMLNQMIQEVNETQVDPCDRLSDHVYIYSAEADDFYTPSAWQNRPEILSNAEALADKLVRMAF